MTIPNIAVKSGDGALSVRVSDPKRPHGIVAVIWLFSAADVLEGKVGEVSENSTLPIGAPQVLNGKSLVIDGFVMPFMSTPPEPYEVVVSVLQGGTVIHRVVPPDHGSGVVNSKAERFRYPFKVTVP